VNEVINTKLNWHDDKKEKPEIDRQVLIRIECYYEDDLKGDGFRVGFWQRNPHGYESWYYLGNLEEKANKMGYIWKSTYWSYLPEVVSVDNFNNNIYSRFELLDL